MSRLTAEVLLLIRAQRPARHPDRWLFGEAIARRRKQEARDLVNSACFAALSDKLVAIDLDLESGRCRLALHRRLRIEATR